MAKQGVWAGIVEQQRQAGAFEPEVFRLWPEHEAAFQLFQLVQTQLCYSDGMPTGLDYCRVRAAPAFRAVPRADRERVMEEMCVIERAWVSEVVRNANERRAEKQHFPRD